MNRRLLAIGLCLTICLGSTYPLNAQIPDELIAQVQLERIERHLLRLEENPVDGKPTHSRSAYRRELIEAAGTYIAEQFESLPRMQTRYDDFSGLRNVIATLPGTSAEPLLYVIGAHYDSKASREADWNPHFSPAPGANDNASGVSLMLEVARVLSTRPHEHTIQFVAFDAEELGLFGSRHYVAEALSESLPIAGFLNVDMIGFNWWFDRVEVVGDPASTWLANYLWLASDWYELGLEVSKNIDQTVGESDHRPFWEAGYRAVMLTESGEPWFDGAHYVANPYYHTYLDTMDMVNVQLVHRVARLVTGVVAGLANQTEPMAAPVIQLLPPAQKRSNPVVIQGRYESDLPLRILVQPGDVQATLDRDSGRFSADLDLKGGINQIRATAMSPGGVRSTSIEVEFQPQFGFREAFVFPNPGRELAQFQCLGDRPIGAMRLEVYQPNGTLIRSIEGVAERSDLRIWRAWWNLKVSGIPVANGVYPCVFDVEVDGEKHYANVTLAVER